jgi:hypothetical protein
MNLLSVFFLKFLLKLKEFKMTAAQNHFEFYFMIDPIHADRIQRVEKAAKEFGLICHKAVEEEWVTLFVETQNIGDAVAFKISIGQAPLWSRFSDTSL